VQFFFSIEWRLDRASPFLRVYCPRRKRNRGTTVAQRQGARFFPRRSTARLAACLPGGGGSPPADRSEIAARAAPNRRMLSSTGNGNRPDEGSATGRAGHGCGSSSRSIWAIDDISLAITDAVGQQDVASRSIGRTSTDAAGFIGQVKAAAP